MCKGILKHTIENSPLITILEFDLHANIAVDFDPTTNEELRRDIWKKLLSRIKTGIEL